MKTVHWQLPFCSLKGTQYRLDIYADGAASTPVQLTGAAAPFTTDEDNSDDFFAPVRTQTGNITVVDTTGTLMADLMPSDNIDRPVRLIRVSDGAIMWQGFLSCEAYSQPYTSRPTEITIPVNSVLAAMDSVKMEQSMSGFVTVGSLINGILGYMADIHAQVNHYYLPMSDINILAKYIDTTVMFDSKEQNNENSVTYEIVGIGLREVLSRLCAYMGWTLRENGDTLYFASNSAVYLCYDHMGTIRPDGTVIHTYIRSATTHQPATTMMSAFDYRGTGHQIETHQGAKSVEVVANVGSENENISMPVRFCGQVSRTFNYLHVYQQGSRTHDDKYGMQIYAFSGSNADVSLSLGCTSAIINLNPAIPQVSSYIKDSTLENVLSHMALIGDSESGPDSSYLVSTIGGVANVRYYAGAFYAKVSKWFLRHPHSSTEKDKYTPEDTVLVDVEGQGTICTFPTPDEGVYCVFFPRTYNAEYVNSFNPSRSKPILSLHSSKRQVFYNGYLNLTSAYTVVYHNIGVEDSESINLKHADKILDSSWSVGATLRIGNRYWNGTEWQDTECRFRLFFQNGNFKENWDKYTLLPPTKGLLIPVNEGLQRGDVELQIWPDISSSSISESESVLEMFFTKLSIEHVYTTDATQDERSENHYFQKLDDAHASEEVTVNTELASSLNNRPSPYILMNSVNEPMTTIIYADGTTDKPERVLLARLAEYYKHPRTRITLEADRPTTPLPLVRITGYPDAEGNTKTYLPLSESRDWHTDTSTITCFETPA